MPAALPTLTLFGQRLRAARLSKEWSQADLGKFLGLKDQNTGAPRISRYERGMHEPDMETIEKLAQALDLPPAYFFAASDTLAECILLISQLSPPEQKEALALLKRLANATSNARFAR